MDNYFDKYINAIRHNVCSICADSDDEGNCSLTEKESCAIQLFLPKIVEIVHNLKTENIHEYYHALKDNVCSKCKAQQSEGNCYIRDDSNCALDRYFILIVETIQNIDRENNQ